MINCQTDRILQTIRKEPQNKYSPLINKNYKTKNLINSSNKENASLNSSYFRKSTNYDFTTQRDTSVKALKFNDKSVSKKNHQICENHPSRKAQYIFENNKCQQAIYFCQMCAITVASKGFSVTKIQQSTPTKTFYSHKQNLQSQIFKQALKDIKQQQLSNLINSKLQLTRHINQINIFFITLHSDVENLKNKMLQRINAQIEKIEKVNNMIQSTLSRATQVFKTNNQPNVMFEINRLKTRITEEISKYKIEKDLFQIKPTKPIVAYLQSYVDKHIQNQQSTQISKNRISISEHSQILTFGNDCTEDSALALQGIDFLQNLPRVSDSSASNMSQFLIQKCAQYNIKQSS